MPDADKTKTDDDVLNGYLDYWDKTIEKWLAGSSSDPLHGCGDDPFLRNVRRFVQPDLMPEPYWGDPTNCSIVIANLNPGRGNDFDRLHPGNAHEESVVWLEKLVREKKSYRAVAESFPLLLADDELEKELGPGEKLHDYGGRHWWRYQSGRIQWAEYMWHRVAKEHKTPFRPFAMELCGWHSSGWNQGPSNAVAANGVLFRKLVLRPLIEAVKRSDVRLGLCCGADWSRILRDKRFQSDIRPVTEHETIACDNRRRENTRFKRKYSLFEIDKGNHIVVTSEGPGNPTPHWSSWPRMIDWLRGNGVIS